MWRPVRETPEFREQVLWELSALEAADIVAFYFGAGTQAPITLLELGKYYEKAIVLCEEGYWRKGNVDIFCESFGVVQVSSFGQLAAIINERISNSGR